MEKHLSLNPSELETRELHAYLLGAVGPRPIAFASTIGADGQPNLAPFSFFNVFSANPPVMIFSPARRVRDNTTKHTLENVQENKEVVINVVSYDMVQQMSLASTEYGKGINEFKKAGFTMLPSEKIKPYRVAESPVQFECKVTKVMALGKEGGAGNLIFSEVVRMHINPSVLDANGSIDPFKLDLVSRLGGNWYSRASKGLFEVPKPLSSLGIGVDAIPPQIRESKILSGNDLGMLGNVEAMPSAQEVQQFLQSNMEARTVLSAADPEQVQKRAKEYLEANDVNSAWNLLLAGMQV